MRTALSRLVSDELLVMVIEVAGTALEEFRSGNTAARLHAASYGLTDGSLPPRVDGRSWLFPFKVQLL